MHSANVRFLFRPQKRVSIYRKNNKPGHNFKLSLEVRDESVNAGQEAQIDLEHCIGFLIFREFIHSLPLKMEFRA